MERVYFSDIGDKILVELSNAKKQVLIAMAWFTNPRLFNGLLECQKRGVYVKLIILDDAINRNDDFGLDFNPLINSFIKNLFMFLVISSAESCVSRQEFIPEQKYSKPILFLFN